MPPATRGGRGKPAIGGYDLSETSPAAAAGVAAFNRQVNTETLAADIRAGRVIPGVDPVANTLETVPYRRYIFKVISDSGVGDSQIARQLASNICGYVAQLPFLPDRKTIVNQQTKQTEYDLQVDQLARAADEQVRGSTGTTAVLIGPSRQIAKTALDLRIEDPDGSKGIAWVNDALPGDRPGAEPSRFDAEGVAQGIDANQREQLAHLMGEEDTEDVEGGSSDDLS